MDGTEPRFVVGGPAQVVRLALLADESRVHLEVDLRDVADGHAEVRRVRFEDVSQVAPSGEWTDWIERGIYTLVARDVRERQHESVRYLVHSEGGAFLSLGSRRVQTPATTSASAKAGEGLPGDSLPMPQGDEEVAVAAGYILELTLVRRGEGLDLDLTFQAFDREPPREWALRFIDVCDARFTWPTVRIGRGQPNYLDARQRAGAAGEEPRFHVFDIEQDGILDLTCHRIVPIPVRSTSSIP